LDRQNKEQVVARLQKLAGRAQLLIWVDYRGLTVGQLSKLRKSLRAAEGKSDFLVAKNTLSRLAFDGTTFAKAIDLLVGPNALLFAYDDSISPTKVLIEALKDMPNLEIKGGIFGENVLSAAQVEALSKMPGREQLLGMLAGVLAAPMRNCAGALAAIPRGLVNALVALKEQKEKAAA